MPTLTIDIADLIEVWRNSSSFNWWCVDILEQIKAGVVSWRPGWPAGGDPPRPQMNRLAVAPVFTLWGRGSPRLGGHSSWGRWTAFPSTYLSPHPLPHHTPPHPTSPPCPHTQIRSIGRRYSTPIGVSERIISLYLTCTCLFVTLEPLSGAGSFLLNENIVKSYICQTQRRGLQERAGRC